MALRLGSPAQSVRAIVSTNSPQTFVVLPQGCDTIAIDPVPPNCASGRGGLFNPNTSTTWQDQGLFGINGDGVGLEAALGYTQYAGRPLWTSIILIHGNLWGAEDIPQPLNKCCVLFETPRSKQY